VDGDALAAGDVADDGVAADGVAALGAVDEEVVGAADLDGVVGVVLAAALGRGFLGGGGGRAGGIGRAENLP
jgi:hypothetical protein